MTDLLKSEFASEEAAPAAETADGQEIPPPAEAAADPADGETPPAGDVEDPVEDGDGEAVADPAETPLPSDAQAALEAWEATGGPLPKPLQALVDKRIGKLTGARDAEKARADQAEAALQAAKAEVEQLRHDPQRPAHAAPAALLDGQTLTKLADTAEKFLAEAENFLDDTATDEEKARIERFMQSERLDANGLKRRVRETSRWLATELPQQRQRVQAFQQQEAATEPLAKATFPWLDDKARPEYQQAQQVLAMMPELRQRTPAHRVALGTYVLGLKVMDALHAAGQKGDALATVEAVLAKAFPKAGSPQPAKAKLPPPKAPTGTAVPASKLPTRTDAASAAFNKNPNRATAEAMAREALKGL